MDERLKWLESRISSSLRPRNEDLKAMLASDENRLAFHEFIKNEDSKSLFVYVIPPRKILASLKPPFGLQTKSIFFMKSQGAKLTRENIGEEVAYTDVDPSILDDLDAITREVFLPLLCADDNHLKDGVVSSDRLMDQLHRVTASAEVSSGHIKGEVILPLPSVEVLAEAAADPSRRPAVLHVLESTVIGWMKQIRGLLKHEPIEDLERIYGKHPGPLDELALWTKRQAMLQSIEQQLESPIAKDIILNLEEAQSQYANSFTIIRKDIQRAMRDTAEILQFWDTMKPWFVQFHEATVPAQQLRLLPPIVHTIMLVWQYSRYYHQPSNFYTLLRVISNEVVHRAKAVVGENIMTDPSESYTKLKDALKVCAAFRGTYLDYRDKSDAINDGNIKQHSDKMTHNAKGDQIFSTRLYGPYAFQPKYGLTPEQEQGSVENLATDRDLFGNSAWPPRNASCFNLLNSFMERCNDVLELVQTTRHFRLLADAANVGGAGNQSLDAVVNEIHGRYKVAMEHFYSSVNNVLAIDGTQSFEKAFFNFRTVVKSLEVQLASIIRQSFTQCPTVGAQLRLLEVFEGISSRELVQSNLKDKDQLLVQSFYNELMQVKTMFNYLAKSPPHHKNMPSVVSKMQWIHSMRQRVQLPMEKMKQISPQLLEGDRGWQLRDLYAELLSEFDKFESRVVDRWQEKIATELTAKLKQPVLVAADYDEDTELRPQVLHVNLDPKLLLLLREIHYLTQSPYNIPVPPAARDLIRNTDPYTLRVLATRLETITSKYNTVMKLIGDYERPLFERKLARIDQLLDKGLNLLTWRSKDLNDFIESASQLVCTDVYVNLDTVQSNCKDIADTALAWCKGVLDVFATRDGTISYPMHQLVRLQKDIESHIELDLVPAGTRIHQLVESSFNAVGISKASPAWEDYTDFMDAIVLNGLKQTTLASLKSMWYQMSEATLMNGAVPILTIRLELIQGRVTFKPPLEESTSITSVQEVVLSWIDLYKCRGRYVHMLGPKGEYKEYIDADEDVSSTCDEIMKLVQHNSKQCIGLLELFTEYSFLWEQDVKETFSDFLRGTVPPNPRRSTVNTKEGPGKMRQDAQSASSSRSSSAKSMESVGLVGTAEKSFLATEAAGTQEEETIPSLDEFDAEIDIYKSSRDEILELQSHCDIGWVRVDLEPVKQVLITYASKWMWTFTSYLADKVTELLHNLDSFLKRIEPEIESIRGNERDTASFMKMMRLFNEVTAQQQEMDVKFAAMHRTVLLLKKYDQALPIETQNLFTAAPSRWNNLKTKVSLAKQRLGPRIQEESERITKDLAAFGKRILKLEEKLDESEVYSYECSMGNAWTTLDSFHRQLAELENEAQDLQELQDLLETDVVNFEILPKSRLNIENLKQVWEAVRVLGEEQNDWRCHRWHKINTKQLRQETDRQIAFIARLPDETFLWDVYMGLHSSIDNIQACLPLIDDLSNPAMRTRHWKQLVRVTGGAVQIDNDTLKRMTLGELLSLGLQTHVDDVRAIVQRAVKDLAIEKALKTYEEVWLSKLFELRSHVRSRQAEQPDNINDNQSEISHTESHASHRPTTHTRSGSRVSGQSSLSKLRRGSASSLPASLLNLPEDTGVLMLLTNTEPIFDELESHQVALQTMQSSSAAGSFMDEVMKWQKRLQTIEAVVSLWLEVQDRWAELEEIYSTAEIRTSLAKDAQLFDEINRDFCLLMRASERNPNILQCCSRKNILAILERMKAALAHCYKALLHQLSRRLQKFPRFYFLSLEDVLHIVCNGYDLRQVNGYIGKLFENIGELTFNDPDDTEKNVYEITGVKSALNEQLTFNQPTTCEGQIETWLPSFLQNITSSLQNQLAVILGAESDGGKKKSIRSAGSRKIIISSQGSRPNSKQQKGEKTPSRGGKRPSGQQPIEKPSETLNEEEGKSWTLDNVTEVVYLVTQLQMTGQIGEACEALEGGDKNAIQNAIIKVTSSIQESVLMLKGFETKHERLEMSRSSSRRAASAASVSGRDKKDESNSHSTSAAPTAEKQRAGGSKQGSRAAGSVRGSMFDLAIEPQKTPIPEEDGSLGPDDHNQPSSADEAHVNTMDLGDTFNKLINKPESEEEEVEIVDQTEIRLMLFPSQIHKISSIIALLAFYRDLLQRLEALAADEKEKKISEAYLWKSQLQYNFDAATKAVNVQCLDMSIEYDFEYQGSAPREVISPVTERVFVNLCMAVKSHTNVIVSGPTGSGRLETVHELTRQLGRPFYWFNCHRSYNHVLLHNVVKGMALTGAWVCLNNMNYLPPALLSELAQLLGTVMSALKQGKTTTSLGQEELQIHSKGACMGITNSLIKVQSTDPESEPIFPSIIATLPNDLLKQFRQVSILKPNLLLTVEALLLGQGFTNAAELAKKMLQLQELCVNLGGVDHTFRDTATIGTDVSKGGWSLQTLKHIIIHSGTVLDKVTSESLTAQYETIHEVPEGDGETLLPEGEQTQRENQESGAPNTEKLNQNDDTDNAKTDGDAIEKADDPKPTDSEKPPTITDDRLKPEKLLADEEFSLVSSLRDTFLPRLGTRDRFVFTSLVSDIWPNAEVALDFAGSQKELAAEAQSQGRLSTKPPSRPFSRTTSTTQAKNKQSKTYIPGIKESLNLNTPVVTIAADFKHETDTKQPEALDDTSDAIAVATANLGLLPGVAFQARVAQLSHLNTAHKAILVVGPPGCGKSECIKTFAVAERERGKSLSIQSVFTKAFEPEAFLGYFDNNNEWHDGLLPHILRKYCSKLPQSTALLPENKSTVKVVLLDGECDPTQMEIMDSILHNDGTIVLGNNERIPMSGHVRFIWESESLKNVTPAILANVGLLVMSRDDLGWQMMLTQWLNHRDDESKILLGDLCEVYVPKLVKFLAEATSPPLAGRKGKDIPTFSRCIRQSEENMVTTFCNLFEAMTSTVMEEVSEEAYERYFVFSLIWSFAGTLEYEDRDAFSVWWRQTFEQRLTWPFSGTIFDYTIDPDSKEFTGWSNVIPSYTGTAHAGIPNDAFVHTISNGQLYYLLSQLSDVGKPVMLIGPPGCGKSSIIKERIRNVSTGEVAEVLALTINANRFTTSNLLYERLNEKLEWKHGRTFVPRGSKRLICLIDDLNLSHVDDQGYQSAVELIRQHLDEGGFYSAENLRWRYVRNVTYVSAINPKQTTTPLLSSRLLRHFAMFNCAMPCAKELQRIYRTLLHTHFITPEMQSSASISASAAQHLGIKEEKVKTVMRSEEEALRNLLTLIVTVTIQLQEKLGGMFLCTAQRCHYSFTMKHLAVIFRNLTLSLQQSSTTQNVLWLWQHECDYVYGSRMVNSFDRNRYETAFNTAVRKDFTSDDEIKQLSSKDKPIFSNLIEQDSGIITAGKVVTVTHQDVYRCDDYKPTWDEKTVKGLLTDAIEEYNKIYPMITIPLHTYTIQQICRLARVISSPYEVAHLHLISEGYPGTTSTMVKLAAHLSDFCTVQINASLNVMNNHNKMDLFKGELVHAYTRAGVKHERTLFLLQDDELFDENFLVFISEFVISGDITHLFTQEEMTTIINSIRTDVTQAGLTYTKEVAWNFFLNTVRNNFRVCFISTDGSAAFQQRCRSFPSLISSLNYIWLPNWSRGTLVKHAHYHLAEVGWMDKTQKENIAHMLGSMHLVIRQADGKEETCGTYNSLTNTTYERFVESYVKLAKRRYDEIIAQHEAITKSLDQIYQENELAAKLHRQLEHEKIVLEERILGTTKILAQIGQDTAITEQQVKIVKQQLEKIKRLKKLLPEYQVAHERAVFKASALAIDTKKIVTNMSMESLQELRAMQKPIIEVEDLMAAVIMILKSPTADLTWQKGAKRQMANLERFIEEMSTFDDQQMAESTLVLVEPYLKKASFKPDTLEKKSANVACGALCKWVHGVVKYHRMMISKVKPLHDKVVSTTSAVDNAEHKMATLDSKRKALEVRLRDLGKGFEDATIDKNDQEEKTIKMDKMLNTAADLREAIQNETARAEQVHKSLKARLACVDGGVAIAAAFSTYLGPYSHNFRKLMLTVQWPYCLRERGIPLVIDTVDHIRGRVIDFAIEGLVPDMDEYDEALPVSARGSQKRGSDRAPTDEDLDSLPDDYDEEEDYEEESDDDVEPELTNDNPAELPEADESTAPEPESSPPTRQKDGQPLEPLHEVHEEEQKTEGPQSVKNNNEGRTPTAIDELISVDGVVSKTQYKAYISSIVRLLVGEQLQLKWVKKDMDTRQLENAAILASSWQRPALLIDPYEEGKQFLMDFSKSVFKMTMISIEDNCMESSGVVALEKAITQGKPALVSGINDRINNMLVPLIHHYCTLNEDHITNGKSKMINYCGRRLLCHPQHQLFLSTSNPRAILNPVIASMTTMISYSTDADALTDKLVKRAFARVRPELYKEKLLVLRNIHTLKELMNRVIEYTKRDLIHSTGNKVWNEQDVKIIAEGMQIKQQSPRKEIKIPYQLISRDQQFMITVDKMLENLDGLCNMLQKSREISILVSKKLNENIETLNKLQALQDELLPVAKRASLLYSLLRSLSVLSKHYQFRLPQFLQIFYEAVGEDPSADVFIEEEEEEDDEEGTAVPSLRTTREPTRVISGKSGSPKNTQTNQVTEGDSDYGDDFERGESGEKEDSMEDKTNEMTSIHDITPYMQLLGNIPEFPTEGIAYTELQANQSTLLVEILTTNVLKYARMSLDGDDLLLFNAIACLTIQKETEHPFTDEELSLLTQGNPGLGMQLSLEDFGSEAKPPEWLARDKWESVMAVSVLPGALDNICVQVAEDADAWKEWYEHENPETIKLPTKPQTDRSKQGETREPQTENTETKKVEQATDGEEPGPSVENAEAGTDAGETAMGEKTTVDGTITDENDLSEMHRLLIIRLLRPDRLMYALREYVERHMPAEQSGPVSFEAMRSYIGSHNLAAMITLPTSYTCQLSMQKIDTDFVGLFSFVADARSVAFKHVTICDGCGPQLDSILESASKSESETWLLIDKLHLAPENLMMEITTKLQRAVRTKILPTVHGWNYIAVDEEATGGQLMIWITTEMTDSIPLALLDLTVSLSWHLMTREFFEAGQPLVGSIPVCCTQHALTRSVVMCLRACDDDTWEKLGAELPSIKVMSFSVALALGLLMARQMYGAVCSSQWYAWSKQHITECMQVLLSQSFSNHDELSMLEGKITFLVHDVFGRFVNSEADRSLIMRLADFVIRSVVFNQVGILYLANHEIPLPPPNVEPIGYAAWFEDTLQKLEPTDVNTLLLHPALLKIHNQSRSISVLEKLEKVSEAQTTDSIEINAIPPPTHINVSQLNMVCSSCLEQLPPLIEVAGMTAVGRSGSYNFPYKPPSAYSDISTDSKSGLLPESIGYILLEDPALLDPNDARRLQIIGANVTLASEYDAIGDWDQECYHMNALLCHVRQSLYDITESIIAGQDGIAAQYMSSARALVKEQVPVSWLHSNLQPSTHNLFSWLDDLQRRYTQIRSWNKSGLVPKPDKQTKQAVLSQDYLFHGKLRMVWLGGLFNPHGLLTALRHEKAVLSNVPFDKISLVCEPAGLDVSEGDLLVEGMFLQAAAWDEECGCLTKSSKLINNMPTVLLKAVVDGAENEGDKEKSETKTSKADEPDSQEKEDKKYGIYYCPIFTTKNRQVLIDYLPMKSLEADCVHWQLTCTCLILDGGLSELYPRHHQLIQPARVDELELAPSEPDSAYQTRLGTAESRSGMRSRPRPNGTGLTNGTPQRRVTSKPPSPESQLSYKRMSPKAQPLPPDLAMTRDAGRGRLGQSQEGNTKANSKAASRHASRQSVFKSILMDEYGSNKAASTTGSDTKSQGGESHVGSVRGTPAHGSPARQPTASLRGSKEGSVTGSKPSSKPASKRVSPALSKRTSPAASKHSTPIPTTSKQPSPAPSNKSATKVSPTGGSRVSPAGSASSQKQSKPASTRSTPHQSPL